MAPDNKREMFLMTLQSSSELEVFQAFIQEQLDSGVSGLTPEESVVAFRAYQHQVEQLREEIRPALERSLRGESEPLDIEDIKTRGRERLRQKGITD